MINISNKVALVIVVATFLLGSVAIYVVNYRHELGGPKYGQGAVVSIKDYYIDGSSGTFEVDINQDGKPDLQAKTDDFGFAKELVEDINKPTSECGNPIVVNGKQAIPMFGPNGVPVQIVKVWNGITPYYKLLPIGVKRTASN